MQGIYSITNSVNNKVYIGQDSNISYRWIRHKSRAKINKHGNTFFQRAINKYGIDKFIYEELIYGPFDKEELTELEQYYMDKYRAEGKVLYNVLPANCSRAGIKASKKTKKNMSLAQTGIKNGMFGKHHTETWKQQNSERVKGKNHWTFGKIIPEMTIEKQAKVKMGNNNPMFGKIRSEEWKQRQSERIKQWWLEKKAAKVEVV